MDQNTLEPRVDESTGYRTLLGGGHRKRVEAIASSNKKLLVTKRHRY